MLSETLKHHTQPHNFNTYSSILYIRNVHITDNEQYTCIDSKLSQFALDPCIPDFNLWTGRKGKCTFYFVYSSQMNTNNKWHQFTYILYIILYTYRLNLIYITAKDAQSPWNYFQMHVPILIWRWEMYFSANNPKLDTKAGLELFNRVVNISFKITPY